MRKEILVAGFACLSLIAGAQSNPSNGQDSTNSNHKVVAPRDSATGQASGKREVLAPRDAASGQASGKMSSESAGQAPAVRESPTKASSGLRESPSKASLGKTSATDDWSAQRESPTKQTGKTAAAEANGAGNAGRESSAASVSEVVVTKPGEKGRVAAGDVDGDGKADAASGPRQSTGQNAAINNSHSNVKDAKDTASGQATGKRQYAPVKFQKEAAPAPKQ